MQMMLGQFDKEQPFGRGNCQARVHPMQVMLGQFDKEQPS